MILGKFSEKIPGRFVENQHGLSLKVLEKLRDSDSFSVKEPVAAYKTTKRKTAPKAANKVSK